MRDSARRATRLGLVLVGLLGLLAASASAQDFPTRPITMLFPYPAGGTGSVIYQQMNQIASKTLGQPIVMDYRTGASGRLGILAQQQQRGNAHVISMVSTANIVALPATDPTFRMEPIKNYVPIIGLYVQPYIVVTNPAAPFNTMRGALDYAKAHPGKLNAAHSGIGGFSHLSWEDLKLRYGFDLTYIGYKAPSEAVADVLSNQIQLVMVATDLKPMIDSGKMVPLAVTSRKHWDLFPNLPTLQEAGFANASVESNFGLVAPPDAPRENVMKLYRAYSPTLKDPAILKLINDTATVTDLNPDDFTALLRQELERLSAVVKTLNLKLE